MDCDTHLEDGHILPGELTLGHLNLGGDVGECDIKIYTEYHTLGKDKEKPYFRVTNNKGFESRINLMESKYNDSECDKLSTEQTTILNDWLNSPDSIMGIDTNWGNIFGQWRGSNQSSEYYASTDKLKYHKGLINYTTILED